MNHKNTKLTLASKIMHILSFLSIIGIIAMMTLNFSLKAIYMEILKLVLTLKVSKFIFFNAYLHHPYKYNSFKYSI